MTGILRFTLGSLLTIALIAAGYADDFSFAAENARKEKASKKNGASKAGDGVVQNAAAAKAKNAVQASPAKDGKLDEDSAVKELSKYFDPAVVAKAKFRVDRIEENKGREYFVIQAFEVVVDDPKTGVGHTATWGWFFVDRLSKKVYELDMGDDKLYELVKKGK